MPRYNYRCEACGTESTIFHLISETIDECDVCEASGEMTKLLSRPTYVAAQTKDNKVGTLTVRYIEENREILEEEKKIASKETYEPS